MIIRIYQASSSNRLEKSICLLDYLWNLQQNFPERDGAAVPDMTGKCGNAAKGTG